MEVEDHCWTGIRCWSSGMIDMLCRRAKGPRPSSIGACREGFCGRKEPTLGINGGNVTRAMESVLVSFSFRLSQEVAAAEYF